MLKNIFKPFKSAGFLRGDLIISAAVCVFALLLTALPALFASHSALFSSGSAQDGESEKMYIRIVFGAGAGSDAETRFYPLDTDGEYKIDSCGYSLTVSVKDKKVCVSESDCPDKICVKTGQISSPGAVIACAPAKVTVAAVTFDEIGGENPDFIAG